MVEREVKKTREQVQEERPEITGPGKGSSWFFIVDHVSTVTRWMMSQSTSNHIHEDGPAGIQGITIRPTCVVG